MYDMAATKPAMDRTWPNTGLPANFNDFNLSRYPFYSTVQLFHLGTGYKSFYFIKFPPILTIISEVTQCGALNSDKQNTINHGSRRCQSQEKPSAGVSFLLPNCLFMLQAELSASSLPQSMVRTS